MIRGCFYKFNRSFKNLKNVIFHVKLLFPTLSNQIRSEPHSFEPHLIAKCSQKHHFFPQPTQSEHCNLLCSSSHSVVFLVYWFIKLSFGIDLILSNVVLAINSLVIICGAKHKPVVLFIHRTSLKNIVFVWHHKYKFSR